MSPPSMTPHDFIRKWRTHALTERGSAQEHFIDLCHLVGHPTPAEDDPAGERFTFEKGVTKTGGGDGYPDRILPKTAEAAVVLKQRTLTNLYNQRPQWLADAHEALDRAVAAAYGWPEDIATEDALARLLALNLERAAAP